MKRAFPLLLLSALAVMVSGRTAYADPVTLLVEPHACFNCDEGGPFSAATSFQGLTFSGANAILELPMPLAPGEAISLGTLTLASAAANYAGDNLLLQLGLNPSFFTPEARSFLYFTATLSGSATGAGGGSVLLDFDNSPMLMGFGPAGRFVQLAIVLDDVLVTEGGSVQLTGRVITLRDGAEVPEPATLLLLGTGLAGVAAKVRRRNQGARA